MRIKLLLLLVMVFAVTHLSAQKKDNLVVPDPTVDSYQPLTLKLNPEGTKYIRFLMWGQFWLTGANNSADNFTVTPMLRRARFLAYAQVSPRFLILMHFGINNLSQSTMNPTGNGALGPQLFMHGAWSEFAVVQKKLYIGGGLHYWNGISRLTSSSTLNFLTLDNYRRAWSVLGLTDQFARHLGVFAKGMLGRFAYRISANSPMINSLDVNRIPTEWTGTPQTLYTGKYEFLDEAAWSYQGYFEYMFFDKESDKLPFKVGTYLGKKKVLNIGAGFFHHPNGSITYKAPSGSIDTTMTLAQNNVSHFAFDVFYDTPLGSGGLTAYAVFYAFDYGPNYTLGQTYGTGNSILVQVGYLAPKFSNKISLQPYIAYNTANFKAFDNTGNAVRAGLNMFLDGHHSKLTLEYTTTQDMFNNGSVKPERVNAIVLQAQVFL
jgi:hypothetical protein